MTKPVVNYKDLHFCAVGASALVVPVNHPSELVSNTGPVRTSTVQSYDADTGVFETLNTRYQPTVDALGQ